MHQIENGRQECEVRRTWDNDFVNTAWYVATDIKIIPQYYQHYFVQGTVLKALFSSLIFTIVMWLTLFIAFKLLGKKKHKGTG